MSRQNGSRPRKVAPTVGEVMTKDLVTISVHASLRDAVELLAKHGISGVPVTSGDHVVGTLSGGNIVAFEATIPGVPGRTDTDTIWERLGRFGDDEEEESAGSDYYLQLWDDTGADLTERFNSMGTPEWDVLAEHTVEEAMSSDVVTLPPNASLQSAADYMRRTGAHRVLVADGGALLGLLTTMDITKYVAGGHAGR
jgi:CBS domain-containing protein